MDSSTSTAFADDHVSFIRDSLLPYLEVRPIGFVNTLRLMMGYSAALGVRIVGGNSGRAVGAVVPGRRLLLVSFQNIRAMVRPGTNDLDLLVHHEPKTISWFRISKGDVVVDVGAHIGRYTLLAARAGARVFSLEPDPSNFQLLEANVRLNRFDDVSVHRTAVSNAPGVRSLILSSGVNRGTSRLSLTKEPLDSPSKTPPRIPVDCVTLDDFTEGEGIPRIDWLKIDVEGHESAVLEGAADSLRATRNLILEVNAGNEAECRNGLERAGFTLQAVERGYPTSNWLLVRQD